MIEKIGPKLKIVKVQKMERERERERSIEVGEREEY
jgi:hypothetical protein